MGIFGDIRHQQRPRRAADAGVRYWGNRSSVTGTVGLLDRVAAVFCGAGTLSLGALVFRSGLSAYSNVGACPTGGAAALPQAVATSATSGATP